jgi:2'-5' RNA ligase
VFSLNVPLPPAVESLAAELVPGLPGAPRTSFTAVCKRLGDLSDAARHEKRARRALRDAPGFEARVSRIGVFHDPPAGPAPVVYLAVESPGLHAVHRRLCETFDPVDGIEGEGYTPHVTLARGLGEFESLDGVEDRPVGPVEWRVDHLEFYDARHGQPAGRVSLPA